MVARTIFTARFKFTEPISTRTGENLLIIHFPNLQHSSLNHLSFGRSIRREDRMHNKKERTVVVPACEQSLLPSSCNAGCSSAQSPYLRCMPIGISHHQDEIIYLGQFPFPLLYQLHILNAKRKGKANSTWWFLIISLMCFSVKAEMGQVLRINYCPIFLISLS